MTGQNYSSSNSPEGWEQDDYAAPANQQADQSEYPQQQTAYYYAPPANQPFPPAPEQKSNTGLYVAIGIAGVIFAAAIGVGAAYFVSNSSDNSAQSPDTVVAGDSSSSTSSSAPVETYTETYTRTVEPTPEQSEDSESSAPTTERGNFGQRAFGINRNDIDAGGWIGSKARCSGGYYARTLVETSTGKAVICENSNNRQQRHYIGDFSAISGNPEAYTVDSFSTNRVVATNGDYTYTVTPSAVTVTKGGKEVFRDAVTEYGVLNAG